MSVHSTQMIGGLSGGLEKGRQQFCRQNAKAHHSWWPIFMSADYGWLTSADGAQSTRVLFKAGKGRKGYFTNSNILNHATAAMNILHKDYKDEDHVLVFDNATTYLKREEDALSASKMPKNTPTEGKNWGVMVDELDEDCNMVHGHDGKVQKMRVNMHNTRFADGSPQSLNFPESHPCPGVFKGMAVILEERGFKDAHKLCNECPKF
jgi:hypothetical protein